MKDKELKGYINLIKIKTVNAYYNQLATFLFLTFGLSFLSLGIPLDFYNLYSDQIQLTSLLIPSLISIIGIINKYTKNKKEFINNNKNINFNTPVKKCYNILKKEEIIINKAPNNIIDRYYIDPEMYVTEKGKKLIRKR